MILVFPCHLMMHNELFQMSQISLNGYRSSWWVPVILPLKANQCTQPSFFPLNATDFSHLSNYVIRRFGAEFWRRLIYKIVHGSFLPFSIFNAAYIIILGFLSPSISCGYLSALLEQGISRMWVYINSPWSFITVLVLIVYPTCRKTEVVV